jgi:serine/threonine protein kinase
MTHPTDGSPPTLHNQVAFDATLDSLSLSSPMTTQESAPDAWRAARTTVLPRLERVGATSALTGASRARFEPTQRLGEGGVGEVVAAVDRDIDREVAIKRLRADAQSPSAVARFVDEIRTVGALEHPNVIPIHDVGVDEKGELYFVMRRVKGDTLESIIERLAAGDPLTHAHWTFERRVHVFRQLLDAVAFAHDHGFVHRDIKPANIMIGAFGEVFLMDWGIAKPMNGPDRPLPAVVPTGAAARVTATHVGAIVGTPVYMSPEQARGERVDACSDIYSLCVLLHELLGLRHYLADATTLEAVLEGVNSKRVPMAGGVSSPHQPSPPFDLSWFVAKGVEKDPARRYQSVREMIDRLDAREDGHVPIQCPITFSKRASSLFSRFLDRHPYMYMAVVLLGLVASVVLTVRHFH